MKRLALVVVILTLAALVGAFRPSQASAHVIFTYAQGVNGVGGVYWTAGYAPRDFNRVYHQSGTEWTLYYCHTDFTCTTTYSGNVNPLVDQRNQGYAQAYCENDNDDSFVTWTCQTTRTS